MLGGGSEVYHGSLPFDAQRRSGVPQGRIQAWGLSEDDRAWIGVIWPLWPVQTGQGEGKAVSSRELCRRMAFSSLYCLYDEENGAGIWWISGQRWSYPDTVLFISNGAPPRWPRKPCKGLSGNLFCPLDKWIYFAATLQKGFLGLTGS